VCAVLKEKRSGVAPEMRARARMRAHRVQSESDDDNESVDDRVSDRVSERNATRVGRRDERDTVDHCRGDDRGRVSRGVTRGGRVYD